jgi:replicative DNA helicase
MSRAAADVVIVDHLQKIATKQESRAYGLEAVMNELHGLALRDNKVILVTAQVGREANSQRRVPRESDLRDSGALEMFAPQLWALYWPHKHDAARNMHDYEVYVVKHSEGPTGLMKMIFQPRSGAFEADPFNA